jgi:hypothetical protein
MIYKNSYINIKTFFFIKSHKNDRKGEKIVDLGDSIINVLCLTHQRTKGRAPVWGSEVTI